MVGISPDRLRSYPHQLSGGMRQRAIIAIALALNPELIIMDEPTTALDVVVQREIINEIKTLQASFGFSVIFITHDLSLLLEISNHVAIMYAGRLVEMADQERLITPPLPSLHLRPYPLVSRLPGRRRRCWVYPASARPALPCRRVPFRATLRLRFDACREVIRLTAAPEAARRRPPGGLPSLRSSVQRRSASGFAR